MPKNPKPSAAVSNAPSGRIVAIAFSAIFLLGLLMRLPLIDQSFWYDELYSILHYLQPQRPWSALFCEYSPNNHLLHSILARLSITVFGLSEITTRIPALLAGCMLGPALAWPIRRTAPAAAVALSFALAIHPWAISISTEARGYSLLLLLAILATNQLDSRSRPAGRLLYVFTLAAGLATVPIFGLLFVGHAIAVIMLQRAGFLRWLMDAIAAVAIAALLYLPAASSLVAYWSVSHPITTRFHDFIATTARHAGMASPNWLAIAIAIAAIGIVLDHLRRRSRTASQLHTPAIVFLATTMAGVLAPIFISAAAEPRFMIWTITLAPIALAIVVNRSHRHTQGLACLAVVALAISGCFRVWQTPLQPIREAIAHARSIAGPDQPVVAVYMAAAEARAAYGGIDQVAYALDSSEPSDLPSLCSAEQAAPHGAILIVLYDAFLQRDQPLLFQYVTDHYGPAERLPGRVSDVLIYRPRARNNP